MPSALLALLLFLALQLGIGIWISRRIRTEEDYLVGGRTLGLPLATFSIFATWFGAETVIGGAASVYTDGFSLASPEPFGYGLCLLLAGVLFAVPLRSRGLTTLADLHRERFGPGVERLAAILLIPSSVLWAAAQVRAFGQIVAATAGWSPESGIGLAALFALTYTAFGGLLADAITDVIQGILLALGLFVLLGVGVIEAGGLGPALTAIAGGIGGGGPISGPAGVRVVAAASAPGPNPAPLLTTLEAWAIPILGSVVATEVVGRILACRTAGIARRSSIAAGTVYIGLGVIPVALALLAPVLLPAAPEDAEQLVPLLADHLLHPALHALFVGGIVAAILSTVDSTLLISSGILSHNLIVPGFGLRSDRARLLSVRSGVVVFGVVAWFLALRADGVYSLVEEASSFGSAGILVTVAGALFSRGGSPGFAAATLVGGIVSYIGAVLAGVSAPFLASLGVALTIWLIGEAVVRAGRDRPPPKPSLLIPPAPQDSGT